MAFYLGTRRGWRGLGSWLTRLRLRSRISHCELVWEPTDGADALMPDGRCAPDADGALWCASASASDPMPPWSPRRAGRAGGVRFKRIDVHDESRWLLVDLPWAHPIAAATWARQHQGALYDWQGILGFVAWVIPGKRGRWSCHQACAAALGHPAPARTDPAALCETVLWRLA